MLTALGRTRGVDELCEGVEHLTEKIVVPTRVCATNNNMSTATAHTVQWAERQRVEHTAGAVAPRCGE